MTTLTITNTTISKLGGPGSCADAIVENSDASYTANVASGATLVLPDTDVEVNGNLEGQVVSVQTVDIQLSDGVAPVVPTSVNLVGNTVNIEVPAAVSRSTAQLMKTGQTTSFATGDDGDIEAGRNTSFTVLAENNPFGNTNRFTDTLGGQTYTNNIVIDWSTYNGTTVLGWYRVLGGLTSWGTAVSNARNLSIGTFTNGWRLPNVNELLSICNFSFTNTPWYLNTAPFNFNDTFWLSTTVAHDTGSAYFTAYNPGVTRVIRENGKTNVGKWCGVRTFTVTGTTLS